MNDFTQIKSKIKNVVLTVVERQAVLTRLNDFINARPLPLVSGWNTFFALRFVLPSLAVMILAIFSVTSWAAEGALPGDLLFPVKVRINEEVRSLLTTNPQAKLTLESQRAVKRLDEAQQLAVRGGLDTRAQAEVEVNLERHVSRFKKQVAALGKSGQAEAVVQSVTELNSLVAGKKSELESLAVKPSAATESLTHLIGQAEKIAPAIETAAIQSLTGEKDDNTAPKSAPVSETVLPASPAGGPATGDGILADLKQIEAGLTSGKLSLERLLTMETQLDQIRFLAVEGNQYLAGGDSLRAAAAFSKAKGMIFDLSEQK